MKTKYELSTNLVSFFSGTYESIWEPKEYNDNGDDLYIEYDLKDLMKSIIDTYAANIDKNTFKDKIPFLKKLTFPGSFHSPREYNFATDTINFDIEISKTTLKKTLKQLESDKNFHKFLKDNYSSYDGFWSFTPDNFQELKEEIETEGNHADQSIGALMTYLIIKDDDDEYNNTLNDIEYELWDEWSGNGYNGLDYKIMCNFEEGQKVTLKDDPDKKVYIITEIKDDYSGIYNAILESEYPIGNTVELQDDDIEEVEYITQNTSLF